MVNLPGNLYSREVKGRNGGFSVGRLVTDIGEFVLRDPFLERYGEGCYRGEFGIAEVPRQLCGGRPLVGLPKSAPHWPRWCWRRSKCRTKRMRILPVWRANNP